MLSRVVNRVYWMARYLERAENMARMISVNANLVLDLPRKVTLGWQPLIDITGNKKPFQRLFRNPSEQNVVRFLVSDPRNGGSLLSSLGFARENARTIRDAIPREGWEAVNSLFLETRAALPNGLARRNRHDFLNEVVAGTQQITGLLAGTMLQGIGYSFLRMGRNLERADMTSRILDVRTENLLPDQPQALPPFENIQWMSVLQSLSAYQGYRQKEQGPVRRGAVLRFLLQDLEFPRAFAHCVAEVGNCLRALPRSKAPLQHSDALGKLVKGAAVEEMSKTELGKFIDDLQLHLGTIHGAISDTYFALPQQQKGKPKAKARKSKV